ncbi:MAG: ribonuclease HII [Bacteroidetes bacterium]|nr:ribonuclease HII [Bacteroidota bacterium]
MSKPTTDYELSFWQNNQYVVGIDEAGRGPLAGPVVAASVILPYYIDANIGFNDSKKLSEKQREELYELLITVAVDNSVSFVESDMIDEINIRKATLLAMQTCLKSLEKKVNHVFIDGNYFEHKTLPFTTVVKGDSKVLSIAAASVLAKISRDRWMTEVADKDFPQYGFAKHKGYGTREHIEAILNYGICPLHRKTFLRNILAQNPQFTLF